MQKKLGFASKGKCYLERFFGSFATKNFIARINCSSKANNSSIPSCISIATS